MSACVRVGNSHTDPITINNGLRQGCTIAPVLFNLYFSLVIEKWLTDMKATSCDEVILKFNVDGRLFHGPRSRHQTMSMTDLEFADDTVLIALNRTSAQTALTTFDNVCCQFGMTVSAPKTKFMVCGADTPMSACCSEDRKSNTFRPLSTLAVWLHQILALLVKWIGGLLLQPVLSVLFGARLIHLVCHCIQRGFCIQHVSCLCCCMAVSVGLLCSVMSGALTSSISSFFEFSWASLA